MDVKFKEGQKFKKNDIIGADKNFFSDDIHGNRFNIGSLQKIGVFSTYSTFEDSAFITSKLSKEMASSIVMQKPVVIGKNANISNMVKIGDKIKAGDELMNFELSFDEEAMNNLLSSVGDELKEEIKSAGKTPIKSKYSGVIEDIKIYSTVDIEELSPSLKSIVTNYYSKINKKKKQLSKYPDGKHEIIKCGMLMNEATNKITTKDGKVKGNNVGEGVLIEFYIRYEDIVSIGDKLTYFTALKSVVGEMIKEGYEPYSEFRPDEEISSSLAPGSILARMTPSILITMFGNKVLVELKRALEDIYNE